jgi:CCR4-NOT transcription complex subunit 4
MDSDQESSECPLCLEVLEADDLNFFPCTCCYQICRFCWHRIRTDENGLCPACRKPYSENPAQFKPLSEEEIQQVKRDRKLKESHKKPKITESRKHLANLRVVQRNLVFVNGLPSRLADTELLRRNDHFGKYGKIVKLVTSPAHNGQLNSICVYITYSRSEEALRAIQALCNYHVDGRTLKATLGTTKYCSRYLKGASCQKADCLYLHEPGDPLASFTKEQMQQGLHLEYERKLMEQYTNKNASGQSSTTPKSGRTNTNGNKNDSPQRRKTPNQATSLISTTNSAITTNGNSDFESGDETQHHSLN